MVRPYLKNIAIVNYEHCIASSGFYVCRSDNFLFPRYCYYLMISDYVVYGLNKSLKGDNSPSISRRDIETWTYPVPPLSEQKKIAKKLDILFSQIDIIEQNEKSLEQIIQYFKSTILRKAINGHLGTHNRNDEPASELLKSINPNFKPCDNSHYRKLPRLWSSIRLGDVCKLIDGEKQCNISRNYLDACYLRSGFGKKCLNGRFVPPNSLLILVDGENSGEIFYTKTGGYQGSTFKMVCIEKKINLEYVLYFINHYKEFLRNHKVGSAIPHLNKKTFRELILPVPPINEQNRIVNIIKKINFHIEQL